MLLRQVELERIVTGAQQVVFRRWVRPTVRAGGTLRTPAGVIGIDSVDPFAEHELSEKAAHAAGFESRAALLAELSERDGQLYRIGLHYAGEDPRVALRTQTTLSAADTAELARQLERIDQRSASGPWTAQVLALIAKRPSTLAALLAKQLGQETAAFKRNVRKLKELGLTESLEVGYRLSPRGAAWLALAAKKL